MDRYPHYLAPTTGDKSPSQVFIVDVLGCTVTVQKETAREYEALTAWHMWYLLKDGDAYKDMLPHCHESSDVLWQLLKRCTSNGRSAWMLCYNAGRVWPLIDLFGGLERGEIQAKTTSRPLQSIGRDEMQAVRSGLPDPLGPIPSRTLLNVLEGTDALLILNDPPNIARVKLGDGNGWLTMLDVRNYGVEPPSEIDGPGKRIKWIRDLWQSMAQTCVSYRLGSIRLTAGSQALHGLKAGYLTHGIHCHNDASALALESRSYFGGRCEAFRIGKVDGPLYHLDFRSLYPSICACNDLPVRFGGYLNLSGNERSDELPYPAGCIAEVTIRTDEPAYPYRCQVPQHHRDMLLDDVGSIYMGQDGSCTIWPVGEFRTVLAGPELEDAADNGRIVKWHRLAWYERLPALHEYAVTLHRLRCEVEDLGRSDLCQWAKALLVALPGKLAQRTVRWIDAPEVCGYEQWGEWYGTGPEGEPATYRSIGGHVQRRVSGSWANDSCPAVASFITSAARVRLLNAIRCAGRGNVYYIDTDSLLTSEIGFRNLVCGGWVADRKMGLLSIRAVPKVVDIHGIKWYIEDGKVVCAGLPRERAEAADQAEQYWYRRSMMAQLVGGQPPKAIRELRGFERLTDYTHGVVHEDGRVTPHEIKPVSVMDT